MQNIYQFRTSIGTYSGEQFIKKLVNICQEMTNDLNVLSFGIIIYDETTPELRKILRDKDYWDALDKSSGDKLVIFSLSDEIRQESSYEIKMLIDAPSSYQDKGKSYSKFLKKIFNNASLLVYPSVLFFQVDNDKITDYRLVPLKRNNIFESTKAIQELFFAISKILNNILPQYYGNRREIFNLVREELKRQQYTMYILQGPKKFSDLISIIKNIFWL